MNSYKFCVLTTIKFCPHYDWTHFGYKNLILSKT